MGGRRFCPKCQRTYHVLYNKPAEDGICDECKAELCIRDDDKPETVLRRLEVYHEQTEPLIAYYEKKLCEVDGTKTPEEITKLILEGLGV
jgi:adenylate kinase